MTAADRPAWLWPSLIMLLAVAARGISLPYLSPDADMVNTGLMARHILQGEFPVFFYGQHYCGAIEAYLVAPVFAALGSSAFNLGLAVALESLLFVWIAYLAAKDMWGRTAGLAAMTFAAIPPYYFLWHSFLPRAAYIETPIFCLLLIWIAFRITHRGQQKLWLYFCYGLVAGLGFWTHFLVAFALLPTSLYLLVADWRLLFGRRFLFIWIGFFTGSAPFWIHNIIYPLATFHYLAQPVPHSTFLESLDKLVLEAFPVILGAYWDGTRQAVIPGFSYLVWALGAAVLVGLVIYRRHGLAGLGRLSLERADGSGLCLLVLITGLVVCVLSGEAASGSRRHFVPLYAALVPLAGYTFAKLKLYKPAMALVLALVFLASNAYGIAASSKLFNAEIRRGSVEKAQRMAALIEAMERHGLNRAFVMGYWDSFELTFASEERVIFAALGDSHYPVYQDMVIRDPNQAWVAMGSDALGLKRSLTAMGAGFDRLESGPYEVLYNIRPPRVNPAPLPRDGWSAGSRPAAGDPARAFDLDVSRWSPMRPQEPGSSYVLDLGRVWPQVCMVRLLCGQLNDYPRVLTVEASSDGQTWERVVGPLDSGTLLSWSMGRALLRYYLPRQDLYFPPRPVRFLRFSQSGRDLSHTWYWSIQEADVYQAAAEKRPSYDPAAALEFLRREKARAVYAGQALAAFLPGDLTPAPQDRPVYADWPIRIETYSILPADPAGVWLALEADQADQVAAYLAKWRMAHRLEKVGGFALFGDLKAPATPPGQVLPPETLAVAANAGDNTGDNAASLARPGSERAWSTGRPRRAGDSLTITLARPGKVTGVLLDSWNTANGACADLSLEASDDGHAWRAVDAWPVSLGGRVFAGDRLLGAEPPVVRLACAPLTAKALRLTVKSDHASAPWSLRHLQVFTTD